MTIQSLHRSTRPGIVLVALALSGPLAVADVRLAVAAPDIIAGSSCAIRPCHAGEGDLAEEPDWKFRVEGTGGSIFHDGQDRQKAYFFQAPMVQTLTAFDLTVWDGRKPLDQATARIMVTPIFAGVLKPSPIKKGRHNRRLSDTFMAMWYYFNDAAQDACGSSSSSGQGAEGLVPDFIQRLQPGGEEVALEAIAGPFEPSGGQGRIPFSEVAAIAALENDEAMEEANNSWIVGDAQGLKMITMKEHSQVLAARPLGVSALAVRPWFSQPGNPLHVMFAETTPLPPASSSGLSMTASSARYAPTPTSSSGRPGSFLRSPSSAPTSMAELPSFTGPISEDDQEGLGLIWSYGPDGVPQLYAGMASPAPNGSTFQNGPRQEARFGRISGMAMDADGTLYVADAGNRLIRQISPEGMVSTVAGDPLARIRVTGDPDGKGKHAAFTRLSGLTLDLATRDLLVADGHAIRRISNGSAMVSTLLGTINQSGYAASNPGLGMPGRTACLNSPQALQVRGDNLVFADQGNHAIRVFNLRTRALGTVFGGPDQGETRFGLLPNLNAQPVPPSERAGIASPMALAISYQAYCALGLPDGLASVDLQRLILGVPTSKPKCLLDFPQRTPTASTSAPRRPNSTPLAAIPFKIPID